MTPNKLPPLPEPECTTIEETDGFGVDPVSYEQDWFTSDQMHAYAAEAIAEDEAVIKKLSTALAEIAVTIGAHLPDGQVVDYRELPELVAEALRQSQSLPAGAVSVVVASMEHDAVDIQLGRQWMVACRHYVERLKQALQADAREKGEEVNYPAAFKFAMQQAVENIKVPKMSPLKQELFKAGTVATINAMNAALATQPAQASEKDNG